MNTKIALGTLLAITMAMLAGCAGDVDNDDTGEGTDDIVGDPTTTDELAQRVGQKDTEVHATGPVALTLPGLSVAPVGSAATLSDNPFKANQSTSTTDWTIDLSKITLFDTARFKAKFDPTSKIVISKPKVTVDHNVGPAQFTKKRLNHFDAVLEASGQMRAVVMFESPLDNQLQFNTGENGIPDPEITIPLFDQPIMFPVFGVPVMIRPTIEVKVGCHLEVAAAGTAKAGAEWRFDVKKGIEFNFYRRYSKDPTMNFGAGKDKWGPEFDSEFPGDKINPLTGNGWFHSFPDIVNVPKPTPIFDASIKAAALANCYVEPRLSVSLYEVVGATVRVRPYAIGVVQADTKAKPPINYSIRYGMKGGASVWAKLPILGKRESPEFSFMDLGGGEGQEIKGTLNLGVK